jgi:sulfide:quinone oxidoreductase
MGRNILVLGGGVGGLSTVRALQEHLGSSDRITLVDRAATYVQGLSLLWLLRGWRQLDDVTVTGVRNALGDAELVQAEVSRIDPDNHRVHTTGGSLPYDGLVVALGAELNIPAVPGLAEAVSAGVAVHYYTPTAAVDAHLKLRRMYSGKIVFLVSSLPYKCPAAPYEGAMLVADLLTETGHRDSVDVQVYSPEPLPMPVAGPVVGAGVVSMLAKAGVDFHPGKQVERIDPAACKIVFADGEHVSFDLLVFIPPHRAPGAVAGLGLSPQGWIPVDAHSLASSVPGLWALGDSASITLVNGKPLPKAAVFAKGQSAVVASGVARHLGYDVPQARFSGLGHCYLELGEHRAARGDGDFYAEGGPVVTLAEPSEELHREKEREEADWLAQWNR